MYYIYSVYCSRYVCNLNVVKWQLESSWILFNKAKSETLTNEHAGFLMGQGLNGHLAKLATLNVHDYLIKVCILYKWSADVCLFLTMVIATRVLILVVYILYVCLLASLQEIG